MQTNAVTAKNFSEPSKVTVITPLRLPSSPAEHRYPGFFHCSHDIPDHHHCPKCEEESRKLPSFWDD